MHLTLIGFWDVGVSLKSGGWWMWANLQVLGLNRLNGWRSLAYIREKLSFFPGWSS